MGAGDWPSLVFYGLLLVFIGGAVIVEFSGRGGRAIRMAAVWAVIFAAGTLAAHWWMGSEQTVTQDGRRIEARAGPNGHFHLTADVNGQPVRFIVDTGATGIALTREDAARLGLDPDSLRFDGQAMTANGDVPTARVRLDRFTLGGIEDRAVPATVVGGDLGASLLGMSYLRRFARVSFEGERLILER
ncbi:TIGR02281 family clan AA aspartic protease [Paracoccus sp. PARArs4]|uniref:retropepsin-like aspartic protease family protein n=1 Tax=Paracoccus sp. PARArs4 TaxID=2853442 RepID=UPI0024A675A8|nr:TIGR02281 family clan AA aspartic protease [Paracoccus sp. PARArs4]